MAERNTTTAEPDSRSTSHRQNEGRTHDRQHTGSRAAQPESRGGHVRRSLVATARGLALTLLSVVLSLALFVLTVLSLAFISLGIGLFTTPYVLHLVRMHAQFRRQLIRDWGGRNVWAAYRPWPTHVQSGVVGHVEKTVALLKDPATWRDIQWLLADSTAGLVTAILPVVVLGEGVFGLLLFAGLWRPITTGGDHTYWYVGLPVNSFPSAALAGLLGLVLLVLALRFNHRLLHLHYLLGLALLAPTKNQALARRVATLSETRHDALDTSAAQLRRIERDLHDGAQARLVAMGMHLGTAESLLDKDPEKARRILAEARQTSADTLNELRDLVHGIHPPVLAERGLADAARALALRTGLPVEAAVDLDRRLAEPVESAAYFAISEMLTNATKYSGAERIWLDVYYSDEHEKLRVIITDNGRGGADPAGGSGIHGIERRLAAFDGLLAVSSPPGGPTRVAMEIPCLPVEPGGAPERAPQG